MTITKRNGFTGCTIPGPKGPIRLIADPTVPANHPGYLISDVELDRYVKEGIARIAEIESRAGLLGIERSPDETRLAGLRLDTAPGALADVWDREMQAAERAAAKALAEIPRSVWERREERTEQCADHVDGRAHREVETRANRLSDECGKLATEKKELLVENAELRRTVEQLRRKVTR